MGLDPSTPGGQTPGLMAIGSPMSPGAAEAATLCPQPRRAYPPPGAMPSSPGEDPGPRSPGYGVEDARNEVCELFSNPNGPGADASGAKVDPSVAVGPYGRPGSAEPLDGPHAGDRRPLSAVSTSAGATPSPDGRASPHPWPPTPESQRLVLSPSTGVAMGSTGNGSAGRRRGGGGIYKPPIGEGSVEMFGSGGGHVGGGAPRQTGKVFIGGVPQDMNQDDLYNLFSEFGGVKKAWLQSYRTVGRMNQSPPHNHRGFGFVIFYDNTSVDQLLGKQFSRFMPLPDGRRLEVKRAVPSSDLGGKPSPNAGSPHSTGTIASPLIGRGGAALGSPGAIGGLGRVPEVGMAPPLPLAAGPPLPMAAALQATYQAQAPHPQSNEGWPGAAVHGSPMPGAPWAAGSDPRAPHGSIATWPTYCASAGSMAASQAMTMPQSMGHPHSMASPQSMIVAPLPYPGAYNSFAHSVAQLHGVPHQAVGQQQQQAQVQALHQQGLPGGFSVMPGVQMVGTHGPVQQSSLFQPQQRTM